MQRKWQAYQTDRNCTENGKPIRRIEIVQKMAGLSVGRNQKKEKNKKHGYYSENQRGFVLKEKTGRGSGTAFG